ncbi:MAG: SMP-30/gluconolactonase/LRE family protein, partial [Caulobacteraceae bacterium]
MTRKATLLAGGIYFGEGPRWRGDRMWFSDFFAHAVKSVSEAGAVRSEFEIDDQPSGLGWLPEGDLLFVSMEKRRLMRRGADGETRLHADLSTIATWHCNDMVVDGRGRAYVGNFGFDLNAAIAERGAQSVMADHTAAALALVTPDGEARRAADGLHFPNGTVITPDGGTLIVGETLAGALTAFSIAADGSLFNRRLWASTAPRIPDGICLDAEGAVWIANPLGRECIRFAEGGEVLDVVETSQEAFACMLGGADGRTLFIMTAPSSLPDRVERTPLGRIETFRASAP